MTGLDNMDRRGPAWTVGGRLSRLMAFVAHRRAMLGSLATLLLKVGGTGLMMGIFLLAARSMSPGEFGRLAVSFNALSFLAVLAVLGQDVLVVRCWGEYASAEEPGLALGAYKFSWFVVLGSASFLGLLTLVVGLLDPWHRFRPTEIAAAAAFLATQVVMLFTAQTTRVIVDFVVSETNREITWRLILLPVVVAGLFLGLTPAAFYTAAAVGLAVAVSAQVVVLNKRFPASIRTARSETRWREWTRRSAAMWASAMLEAAAQYSEVLLLGVLVSPATAGAYFVAARLANVFAMISGGLHSYTVSLISGLHFAGRTDELQALLRSVMLVALVIAAPMLIFVLLLGNLCLALFGAHYADGYWTLVVLSVATFAIAMTGPSSGVLLVAGYEVLYSRVLFVALLARVALVVWAAPRYGALGVAAAWAGVNGPVAVGLSVATYRLTGTDPSVLSLTRRRPSRDERSYPA